MDDLISRLSEIRSRYNCFNESEEPYYRALSEAIKFLSGQADGDTISRKAAIERIEAEYQAWGDEYDVRQILGDLEDLPSAQQELPDTNVGDIVPVIRCRDCKRWKTDHPTANGYHCCHRIHNAFPMREDDFCSRAERREE